MSSMLQDLKYAVRGLRKRRLFTFVALLTIAVGIAANTAIFSVVNAVLLRPLPFRAPDRLVALDVRSTRGFLISLSIPNYSDWKQRNRVFESFGAEAGWGMILTGRGQAEALSMRVVLGEFFETLGIAPTLGRVIPAEETGPGAEAVAVLGYQFWQRIFGGDPAALGQTLVLDDQPFTVVGVMPPEFGYPTQATELYIPMGVLAPTLPWGDRESSFGTRAIARLAAGVSLARAQQDMDRVGREVRELEGKDVALAEVRSLTDLYVGDIRPRLWILTGAVGFVLLIACANVANLLLARGEDRRREMAVRTALGASRGLMVRHVLVESTLLSLVGGALGLVFAGGAIRLLIPTLPSSISDSVLEHITIDRVVLLFTAALSILTGLVFGLVPALRTSQRTPIVELRVAGQADEREGQRLRAVLVVAEVALALVLLIGAGLMIQSLERLRHTDKGFTATDLLTARVIFPSERYPGKERWRGFYTEVLTRARALPGVRSAAVTLLLPLTDRSWEMGILAADVPFDHEKRESVLMGIVSEDYFAALGVPILEGRNFTNADRDETDLVAIIDQTMADKFWPGQSAIGKRVTFEMSSDDRENAEPVYRTVVGVAKNVRHYELASPSRIQIYIPLTQSLRYWGMSLNLLLKTTIPAASLVEPLRRTVGAIDPSAPVSRIVTMQEYVDADLSGTRAMGSILVAFGFVALLLSSLGIFGVMSYSVARRTREIGIRMALGARGGDVVGWITGTGAALSMGGILVGLLAAAALTRLLAAFLYEVSPLEPVTYGVLTLLLLGVSLVAAYIPARRATRVDPVDVLKGEG